jgi:cobalt-zinc-cadmium efflux system outer membrane protein
VHRLPSMKPHGSRRRRYRGLAGLLCAGLSLAQPAMAADRPPLSLQAVIDEAKANNPGLQAARQRATALGAVPAQVSALDDPTLSWEAWNAPSIRVDHADNNIFRVTQRFPFPGKRRLAGEVAEHEAAQARDDARSAELDVVAAATRAYYDLWEAYARLAIYVRDRNLAERFSHIVEQRYATGAASQSDVLRAQVEFTHQVNQVQTQALTIGRAEAELRGVLSRDGDDPLGVPMDPPAPALAATADHLVDLALSGRPELAAQDAAITRAEAAVALAHRNYYPDFEVSVGRFENYSQRDGYGALASVTLPIFNGGKYAAGVAEANARLDVARSERRRLEDRVRREVRQAYLAARTAMLQHQLFLKTHIPQVEQALQVTESGYQSGAVSFLDLIDTLRSIESTHLEHITAQADFERAYADLERVVGETLPRQTPSARAEDTRHHG